MYLCRRPAGVSTSSAGTRRKPRSGWGRKTKLFSQVMEDDVHVACLGQGVHSSGAMDGNMGGGGHSSGVKMASS